MAHEAKGDFLMKTDAHCAFSPGWDVKLAEECADYQQLIPLAPYVEVDLERRRIVVDPPEGLLD